MAGLSLAVILIGENRGAGSCPRPVKENYVLRAQHTASEAPLPSEADTDFGERSIEPDICLARRIDTAIHGAEKVIRAIADADPGVRHSQRDARKSSGVGNGNIVGASFVGGRVRIAALTVGCSEKSPEIAPLRLVVYMRALSSKQNSGIYTPIRIQRHAIVASDDWQGSVPGQRRPKGIGAARESLACSIIVTNAGPDDKFSGTRAIYI